jgi:hypothetical protein
MLPLAAALVLVGQVGDGRFSSAFGLELRRFATGV